MYVPAVFEQTDLATLHDFVQAHPFAVVCSLDETGAPTANHIPLLLDRAAGPCGQLLGHMARPNPQWRQADGRAVLAVFAGPHHYISPTWYEEAGTVPTWNFVAVHAAGTLHALHDRGEARAVLERMVEAFERDLPAPWHFPQNDTMDRMLGGIVAFRIDITSLQGKWKHGQNHPPARRQRAAVALRGIGGEDAQAIADLMDGRR